MSNPKLIEADVVIILIQLNEKRTHGCVYLLFVGRRDEPIDSGLVLVLIGPNKVEKTSRYFRMFVDVKIAARVQWQETNKVRD